MHIATFIDCWSDGKSYVQSRASIFNKRFHCIHTNGWQMLIGYAFHPQCKGRVRTRQSNSTSHRDNPFCSVFKKNLRWLLYVYEIVIWADITSVLGRVSPTPFHIAVASVLSGYFVTI